MCAGIVTVAKPLSIECQMANYSNSLYEHLEEETGVKTGQSFDCSHIRLVPMITAIIKQYKRPHCHFKMLFDLSLGTIVICILTTFLVKRSNHFT